MTTPSTTDGAPTIQAATFQLLYLDATTVVTRGDDSGAGDDGATTTVLPPTTWFAVQAQAPVPARYLHVFQVWQEPSQWGVVIYLLADRDALGADGPRLPQEGAWLRTVVEGTVHVLCADTVLSRADIMKQIGDPGHDPPPAQTNPPKTLVF